MRKKGVLISVSIVVVLIVTMLIGCKATAAETTAASGTTAAAETTAGGGTILVGLAMDSLKDSAHVAFHDAIIKFGEESNPKIDFIFTSADMDVTKQASDIKDLIQKKVQFMVISPVDSLAIASSIQDCKDAGIPTVISCRPANPKATVQPNVNVAWDWKASAYEVMTYTLKMMQTDGIQKINIITVSGDITDQNSVLPMTGCGDAVKDMGQTIIQDIPSNWDPEKARSGLAVAFQAHPEVNCIFFASDYMLKGADAAYQAAGRWLPYDKSNPEYVYTVAVSCFSWAYDMLKDKYIVADALGDSVSYAKVTVDYLLKMAAGQKYDNEQGSVPVPVVNWDNYNSPDMLKMLTADGLPWGQAKQ
jgi:ribose transport system substrate-binding protein